MMTLYEMTGNPFLPGSPMLKQSIAALKPLLASEQEGFMGLNPSALPQAVAASSPAAPRPSPVVSQAAPVAPTPTRPASSPLPASPNYGPAPQSPPNTPATDYLGSITQRRMDYERQLGELSQAPDYSQLQSQMATRQQSGERDLMAAMLAGMGPQAVRNLQAPLTRQAMEQMGPMKVEGGMIMPGGDIMMDPGFQQQRKVDALRQRLIQLDQLELRARDAMDKNEIARERNMLMMMIAQMKAGSSGSGGSGSDFGGPAVVVGKDDEGNEVYRHTKTGQLFRYDQGGVPQPYQGEIFSKSPLPPTIAVKLSGYEGQVNELSKLMQSWKPEFAATYPGTGQAEIFASKYMPGVSADQANWWQNYQRWANLVRNSLFGSALTAHEKAAFDAANIGPNQKNDLITTNLQQQMLAAHEAYQKLAKHYKRNPNALGETPTAPLPGQVTRGRVLPRATSPQGNMQLPSQDAIAAELARRGGR